MDLASLIDKVGVPVAICLVVGYYLRKDVVIPLVRRYIKFLDCLERVLEESEKRAIINTHIAGNVDRRLAGVQDTCDRIAIAVKAQPSTGIQPPPALQFGDIFSQRPQPKTDDPSDSPSS